MDDVMDEDYTPVEMEHTTGDRVEALRFQEISTVIFR